MAISPHLGRNKMLPVKLTIRDSIIAINIKWVFRNRRFEADRRREFAYFTLIIFAGLTLSEAIIYVATEFIEVHYTISKAVSIFFIFLFNFFVKKWLLFP